MAELAVCPHVFTFISLPHLGARLDNARCRKKGAFAKSHGPASKCLHKRVLSQFWLHFCENWCFNHHLSCYDNHLQTSRLKTIVFFFFHGTVGRTVQLSSSTGLSHAAGARVTADSPGMLRRLGLSPPCSLSHFAPGSLYCDLSSRIV